MQSNYTNSMILSIRSFVVIEVLERIRLFFILITRLIYDQRHPKSNQRVGKKFIFNTQYIWAYSELEFMCAAQLQSEGHEVKIVICDGLPYTEREIASLRKPSYKSCANRTKRYCKAYGLEFLEMSTFLNEKDRIEASELAEMELDSMKDFKKNGINLGELAKRNHAHYFKGDIEPAGVYENIFRKAFESAVLITSSISKLLTKHSDFDLVTANGKFIQTAIPAQLNQKFGNSFYTYEVFGQGNGVILDKNKCSMEQRIDEVWNEIRLTSLSEKELERLYYSFDLQEKSKSSAYDLWDENRIDDIEEIISQLGIDQSKKVISCYPNVYWDSTHMGLQGVSRDLTSWLIDMINFASSNQQIQLIIRSHPGELRVPKLLQSKFTILDSLEKVFTKIPKNVILIAPKDNISSYSLASISDVNLVWNGTIGLEFALRGIKPIVVADAYYSKKGFTKDLLDFENLTKELLDFDGDYTQSEDEKKLAEVFAYHIRFNRKFNPPYYYGTRSYVYNYRKIIKGKNKTLDAMTAYFLDNVSYMGIGQFDFDTLNE